MTKSIKDDEGNTYIIDQTKPHEFHQKKININGIQHTIYVNNRIRKDKPYYWLIVKKNQKQDDSENVDIHKSIKLNNSMISKYKSKVEQIDEKIRNLNQQKAMFNKEIIDCQTYNNRNYKLLNNDDIVTEIDDIRLNNLINDKTLSFEMNRLAGF